jgi:hypothetical protein
MPAPPTAEQRQLISKYATEATALMPGEAKVAGFATAHIKVPQLNIQQIADQPPHKQLNGLGSTTGLLNIKLKFEGLVADNRDRLYTTLTDWVSSDIQFKINELQ